MTPRGVFGRRQTAQSTTSLLVIAAALVSRREGAAPITACRSSFPTRIGNRFLGRLAKTVNSFHEHGCFFWTSFFSSFPLPCLGLFHYLGRTGSSTPLWRSLSSCFSASSYLSHQMISRKSWLPLDTTYCLASAEIACKIRDTFKT